MQHGIEDAAKLLQLLTMPPPELSSDSELGAYTDTYLGLRSFWSDDIISTFAKHFADGTLDQIRPLVTELCEK